MNMNKLMKFRFIVISSITCFFLTFSGCSELFNKKLNYPISSKNDFVAIYSECELLTISRLNDFYGVLSEIIRNDNEDNYQNKLDSLNYYWCRIIEDKESIIQCLINNSFKCYKDKCFYGERYLKNLNLPLYPQSVHKIFWIKILEKEDFLFGRRFSFGDSSLVQSIHHPTSIFPIFINSTTKTLLPEVDTSRMFTFDDFSYFRVSFINYRMNLTVDSSYLFKIDSLLLTLKSNVSYTTDSLNVFWTDFEKRLIYSNKDTLKLTKKILGKDACQ